jgi:hypothetical protein
VPIKYRVGSLCSVFTSAIPASIVFLNLSLSLIFLSHNSIFGCFFFFFFLCVGLFRLICFFDLVIQPIGHVVVDCGFGLRQICALCIGNFRIVHHCQLHHHQTQHLLLHHLHRAKIQC